MNPDIDVDRTLQRWLEEGPSELPDRVLDETAVRLDETTQRRPSWLPWASRGGQANRVLMALGGATAALLVAIGLYGTQHGGLRLAVPGPAGEVVFTSERHAYRLLLPDDSWRVVQFPGVWLPGTMFHQEDRGVDMLLNRREPPGGPYVLINSQDVPAGVSFERWLDDYRALGATYWEGCLLAGSDPTRLGGVPAIYDLWACDHFDSAEVTAFHNGRAYVLRVFGAARLSWDPRPVIEEWVPRFSFADR